jgi:hypothetical protein
MMDTNGSATAIPSVSRWSLFGGIRDNDCNTMAKAARISNKRILDTYRKMEGNATRTAKALKMDRSTLWRMRQLDPELSEAMAAIEQGEIDEIITAVKVSAKGIPKMEWVEVPDGKGGRKQDYIQTGWLEYPNMRAAQMFLNAHAKDRGYGKQEIDLGNAEGTQLLITNTVVRRGEVQEGNAIVIKDDATGKP